MKPEATFKTSLRYLKGVGPERYKTLCQLGLYTLGDVLYFFPRRHEDRQPIKTVSALSLGEKECVRGSISSRGFIRARGGRSIFRVVVTDEKSVLLATWFNQPYLAKIFLPKSEVIFYGKVEKEGRRFQMIHPEFEILKPDTPFESIHSGRMVPIYPLTEDLSQKGIRQLVYRALGSSVGLVRDPLPPTLKKRLGLMSKRPAFFQIHFPDSPGDWKRAYERLVFDEFFQMQILIEIKKRQRQIENKNLSHAGSDEKVGELIRSLGFALTPAQQEAIADILKDMKRSIPMNRLVEGDVGSGKTVVAAAALVFTASNGFQGALMAPTQVLAQQHYFNLSRLLEPLGICCAYLAQGLPSPEKQRILTGLQSGEISFVVGTHTLIQENVRFKKLGLAVIDEQHKFGVFQRAALKEKGFHAPHFLLMTATPIPRTLAMTLYGDLDISLIRELPKGRKPVKTLWVGSTKRQQIYALLDQWLEKGQQGYVICPLIEEQSDFSAKGVLQVYKDLSLVFSHRRVGILHGRMPSLEKKKIMQDFKEKRMDVLVSTVVIEVGVDVPNANILIIENAEKFGLSQLHQLRGRVGRGSEEAVCILFSDSTNEETIDRLTAFIDTQSGFEIAEKDLELRGAGDIVGEKQHGLPNLRIGDLIKDISILEKAKKEARGILETDPALRRAEHQALKQFIRERFDLSDPKMATLS